MSNQVQQQSAADSTSMGFVHTTEGKDFDKLPTSQKLVLVQHSIELWSGQRKLEDDDYNIAEGKELMKDGGTKATSGMKWLIDRQHLNPFGAAKKRFMTILSNAGVRFMNGYAVPLDRWDEVKQSLDEEVAKFEDIRKDFLAHYEEYVESWAIAHPLVAESIRNAKPSLDRIDNTIHAGYIGVRLNPVSAADAEQFEKAVDGLAGQLIRETVFEAQDYQRYVLSREKLNGVNRLVSLVTKLRGLSFLANGILPFANLLTTELAQFKNDKGKLDNSPEGRGRVLGIIGILANRDLLTEIVNGKVAMTEVTRRLNSAPKADVPNKAKPQSLPVKEEPAVVPETETQQLELIAEPASTSVSEPQEPVLHTEIQEPEVKEEIATPVAVDSLDEAVPSQKFWVAPKSKRETATERSVVEADPQENVLDLDEIDNFLKGAVAAEDKPVEAKAETEAETEAEAVTIETKEEDHKTLYVVSDKPAKATSMWF